ncbi:hypothetical protein JCM8547_001176 [Rhodosporidiobolus lusitaniae]
MSTGMRTRPSSLPSVASWFPRASPVQPITVFARPLSTASPAQTGKKKSQWIARQQQDPYVRARSTANSPSAPSTPSSQKAFVARSAFKLIELHEAWPGGVLRPGMTVVDLGAAPGGWIQAAQDVLKGKGVVVGVDLLPLQRGIGELDRVRFVQGDFLDPLTQALVRRALREATLSSKPRDGDEVEQQQRTPPVDLVLSDMMGNMSGSSLRDAQLSLDLSEAALAFAVQTLSPLSPPPSSSASRTAPSSTSPVQLIIKHFTSTFTADFRKELQRRFKVVKWVKPDSSRSESREGFFMCAGFRGREEGE